MMPGIIKIALRSIDFYRRQVLYQVIIILLLCAVITGSLLTGNSVRSSLKKSASRHLGTTGVMASSGSRYMDAGLPLKLRNEKGVNCSGILEIKGSVTKFISQKTKNNVNIFAVDTDFFSFQGESSIRIDSGKIFINQRLADLLNLQREDEVIIKIPQLSDIPADAPFAPSSSGGTSIVLKIGKILTSDENGNFSLAISQIVPANVFINLTDLQRSTGRRLKLNRILFERNGGSTDIIAGRLKTCLSPEDIGLKLRYVNKSDSYEIISDRVFIDQALVTRITDKIKSASPVITYLANSIRSESGSTPYSFVSALPESLYPEIPSDNGVIINHWLANDLKVAAGDTLRLSWFAPDSLNHLTEKSGTFIVRRIVEMDGIWGDSTLMPDFPGISRSESCSGWDAGVPIKLGEIRDKDESYWKKFRGTPKAFINYKTGKLIWGNNFGPATSVRFPPGITAETIHNDLLSALTPEVSGIVLTDIYNDSMDAASNSVDFSTLFLALGFFLILASIVLLLFAVSSYFELRKPHVFSMHALGFKNSDIRKLLLAESSITALAGCIPGAFAGDLVNSILTLALNSVWKGAVQTNTLTPGFAAIPVITGFIVSFVIITCMIYLLSGRYLRSLNRKKERHPVLPSPRRNLIMLIVIFAISFTCLILAIAFDSQRISLCFLSGTFLFFSMLLAWRQHYLNGRKKLQNISGRISELSGLYYSFYSSNAIAPIAFIAAGIFAFFITAVNRKDFDSLHNDRSSGTGGYLIWAETTIPVKEDMNAASAKATFGFDEDSLASLSFTQMKRSSGNDASCLNLNHIAVPPLLGIDPGKFISEKAFSFARVLKHEERTNPWSLLDKQAGPHSFYGIADQTVLDWGLKLAVGDTLILRAENGQPVNIIIAAGLQSSVFQGYVLISGKFFNQIYPSVSGSTVFLAEGDPLMTDTYYNTIADRFQTYGIDVMKTSDRLASFYEITNTYLSVFAVFGGLGMIIGIAGLGFVLLRNYNQRRREFGLMLATGFSFNKIRKMIFSEQMLILIAGLVTGIIPAAVATLPSLGSNHEISWLYLTIMILLIAVSGLAAILISLRSIKEKSLVEVLRKE